jgi:hypothetical protein
MVLSGSLGAQPPRRIHYQGRLTDTLNQPINTATTVYFSLWQGGSETTANQTTQLYREVVTITPDSNGVFNHDIGNTATVTVELGAITAALFDNSAPVFVQVAIGTVGNVMLPRARVTSVGYAFIAGNAVGDITPRSVAIQGAGMVINSGGQWVGGGLATAIPGAPQVSSITDLTGGVVVVGDVLRLAGTFPAAAVVTIGGQRAPIKSQTPAQIDCQVPAGIPPGLNEVTVVADSAGTAAVTVGQVFVHRYLVWVAANAANSVIIVDPARPATPANNQIVAQINPGFTISIASVPPVQLGFVNQGSVVLVPSNGTDRRIRAIDLTANPPALIGTTTFDTLANPARAVAGSPDGQIAVVSDPSIEGLRIVRINEAYPPYTNGFFGAVTSFDLDVQNGLSGFADPRGLVFVNDTMLLVCGEGSNEVIAVRRNPSNNSFSFFDDVDGLTVVPRASVPGNPFAVRLMPDLTRVLISTTNDLQTFYLAPEGYSTNSTFITGAAGARGVALAPDSKTGIVADPLNDRLHVYHWVGQNGVFVGDTADPVPDQNPDYLVQMAAIEPVLGEIMAVANSISGNTSRLQLYRRTGGTHYLLNELSIATNNRPTYALEFQH